MLFFLAVVRGQVAGKGFGFRVWYLGTGALVKERVLEQEM